MKLKYIYGILFFVLLVNCRLHSQNNSYEYLLNRKDTFINDIRLYGNLFHQHHDFFNKAFSFQGVEAGISINHKLFIGLYTSFFVSNLEANISNKTMFVWIGQGGLSVGKVFNYSKVLHSGCQLNMGYFELIADKSDIALYSVGNPVAKINGMVLSPQIFAELNITRWMKLRTGLSYNFYSFEDQSLINKDNLQNISLNFGFVFAKSE